LVLRELVEEEMLLWLEDANSGHFVVASNSEVLNYGRNFSNSLFAIMAVKIYSKTEVHHFSAHGTVAELKCSVEFHLRQIGTGLFSKGFYNYIHL